MRTHYTNTTPELKTLEWNILNPNLLINLEINNKGDQALFNLEIKKKKRLSIDRDIHHSKVSSSDKVKIDR